MDTSKEASLSLMLQTQPRPPNEPKLPRVNDAINNMNSGNELCALCKEKTAEVFCPCLRPVILLCATCVSHHLIKNQGLLHTTWTLDKLPHANVPGLLERLQQRTGALVQVRGHAWNSVEEVDKAISQYGKSVQQVIDGHTTKTELEILDMQKRIEQTILKAKKVIRDISVQSQRQTEELQRMKTELTEEVQKALEEVEKTLADDKPRLTSKYGPAFRQLLENAQSFQLFSFHIQTSTVPTVTLITQIHSAQEIMAARSPTKNHENQFAAVFGNKVETFDLKSRQSTRFTLSVNFGVGGCYIRLAENSLICIGAYPPSTGVHSLDLNSQKLTPLPPLPTPRAYAGVGKYADFIYVFGGFDGSNGLKSTEKYHITENQWLPSSNMHYTRSGFTPCNFNSLIYLADTYLFRVMESFNPQNETFLELPVLLPTQLELGCDCAVFVVDGEMCVLTEAKQLARWKIGSEAAFRLSVARESCWSSQPPLVANSLVLIANACSGRVDKFSLETYAFL